MSNKKIVRSVYPKSECRISAYGKLHDKSQLYLITNQQDAFGWGRTAAEAWKDAALQQILLKWKCCKN